jgi:hypothetical protein
MTSAHFIYIPAILLIGVVIGWILGSRAAADAYAVQLKRDQERISRAKPEQRERQ